MAKYQVHSSWSYGGITVVEADSVEEAQQIVEDIPELPSDGEYIDSSFQVDCVEETDDYAIVDIGANNENISEEKQATTNSVGDTNQHYGLTECCMNNLGYLFLQILKKDSDTIELLRYYDGFGLHECVIPNFIDRIEKNIYENNNVGNAELKILHDKVVQELKEGSYFDIDINHYFTRIDYELKGRDTVVKFFKNCFLKASEEYCQCL